MKLPLRLPRLRFPHLRSPHLRSIAVKLVLAGLLVESAMLSLLLASNTHIMQTSQQEQFATRLNELEGVLEAALAVPLVQRDYGSLQDALDTVHARRDVEYLELTDRSGRVMAAAGPKPSGTSPDVFDARLPITLGGQVYGTLRLGLSTTTFIQSRRSLLRTGVLIALGEMMLSALILSLLAYRMTSRLRGVSRGAEAVARGDLGIRLDTRRGADEIDRLAENFNLMAAALEARLSELKDSQDRLLAATREAEAARSRSDLILAAPEEGICGIDTDGRVVFVNPAAQRMFGWSADEGIGQLVHERVHHRRPDGTPYPGAECPAFRTLADGAPRHVENEVYWRKDGSSFPVEYGVTAIRGEGGAIQGAVLVFRDISERLQAARELTRRSEQLSRSNAELEQFAYVASHDLREPLRMISSYIGLIERRYSQLFDGEGREFLGYARDGAVRMDQLVRDLLEFSRVGRLSKPPAPVPLGEAVNFALEALRLAIDEAKAEIVVAPDLPTVMGDPTELTRLIQNLVGNALKYRADDRPPRIEIGWCPSEAGMVEAWVKDNGIGIEPQYFQQIFLIFKRLHERQSHGGGSGIGLSICKKIVEHLGGSIWPESQPGQGSTFHFTLPLAP